MKVEVKEIDHLAAVNGRPRELWTLVARTRSKQLVLRNIMTSRNEQFPRDRVTVLGHVEIYVTKDGERSTISIATAFDNLYRHFFPEEGEAPEYPDPYPGRSLPDDVVEGLMDVAAPGRTGEFKPYHFSKLWSWFTSFVDYLHLENDEEE